MLVAYFYINDDKKILFTCLCFALLGKLCQVLAGSGALKALQREFKIKMQTGNQD